VGTTSLLVAALLLPTAIGYAVVAVARARHGFGARRSPALPPVPIERLRADLCRLHAQLDAVEVADDLFGKNLHVNAVRMAYVQTLCIACRQVGEPPPEAGGRAFVPLAEIYRAEAALRGHGLDVRGADAR
jgi:hypothetical protein